MRVYIPKDGYQFNEMRSLPRNRPCPCNSGKKFKKCHLPIMPDIIPTKETIALWKQKIVEAHSQKKLELENAEKEKVNEI